MSRQYTLQRAPRSTSVHIDYAAELNEQQLAAVTAQAREKRARSLIAWPTYSRMELIRETFCCSRLRTKPPGRCSIAWRICCRSMRADFGAAHFTRSVTGCCAATAARSVTRARSQLWTAKIKKI